MLWIRSYIYATGREHGGVIALMSNRRIITVFSDPITAVEASLSIMSRIEEYNKWKPSGRTVSIFQQLISETVRIINDELIEKDEYELIQIEDHPFMNKIVMNTRMRQLIGERYITREIPELILSNAAFGGAHYELIKPVNFLTAAESIVKSLAEEEEKKNELQQKLEAEIKKLKLRSRSSSSVTIARELDTIGNKLQELLDEIDRYIQRRSTDRELIKNVHKMISNVYNLYKVEISRIIIE